MAASKFILDAATGVKLGRRATDINSDAAIQASLNHCPIQTRWLNTRATEFESDNDSLGGGHPSLNRVAASDVNSDVAIRARFSGCVGNEFWV
ncbi:hypothetical protein PCASD_20889 [Puccinia coronata f. sp. avenae]|uniref:Uncharacterized protein n=1 Tax=Puccinia coronata f. sp. avenae TaxID=200324 RepID=A0A2N5TM70_9BASI|nr:hypothetical protein PCASD_20889 [Puccinia coronata f. sp. avenae]